MAESKTPISTYRQLILTEEQKLKLAERLGLVIRSEGGSFRDILSDPDIKHKDVEVSEKDRVMPQYPWSKPSKKPRSLPVDSPTSNDNKSEEDVGYIAAQAYEALKTAFHTNDYQDITYAATYYNNFRTALSRSRKGFAKSTGKGKHNYSVDRTKTEDLLDWRILEYMFGRSLVNHLINPGKSAPNKEASKRASLAGPSLKPLLPSTDPARVVIVPSRALLTTR